MGMFLKFKDMKKILILLGLFLGVLCYSQDSLYVYNGQVLTVSIGGVDSLLVDVAFVTSANMITNGTFDDETSWTLEDATWTISGGTLNYVDAGALNRYAGQLSTDMVSALESDTNYKLTFTVSNSSTGITLRVHTYTQAEVLVVEANYINGTHEVTFTTGTITEFGISFDSRGGSTGSIDNIILELN